MRVYPSAVASHLAARLPLLVHALIWLQPRDRSTREVQPIGLWTGADHQEIAISGEARTYYGVGPLLGLDDFTARSELESREWSFQVSPLHDQVVEAVRLYDSRLAPIDLHLWYCDASTQAPLADPVREFRGTVTGLDIHTPPIGGQATCTVKCISDAWRLTRGLTTKRSASALMARSPADTFRQYNAISGSIATAWGEEVKAPDPASAAPRPWAGK